MLEEDRILEEQKHFDLERPLTPRHRSPSHSLCEADILHGQDRRNYSAADETLPLISVQRMISSVGNDILKSKGPVEEVSLNFLS